MESLLYFKRKFLVTILRLILRLTGKRLSPSPDEVLQIPSRDAGRTIKVHIYRPRAAETPGPVLLNFHGSGFVAPLHGDDDEFCRLVASKTDYTVVDVSYRLAPEDPFPAAVNDTEDAINWVLDQLQEFDLSHVALSGFSAGANLALVASSSLFPKGTFRSLIAFYPPTDISIDAGLKFPPDKNGKPLPTFLSRFFTECYVPANVDARDPRISPSFAPPENFPAEVLLITCSGDDLAPEAEELAESITAKGKSHVVLRRMEGCDHGWNNRPVMEGSVQEKAKSDAYSLSIATLRI